MGKTKTAANLPSAAEFLNGLETVNEQCIGLLSVKSREIKIPATVRAQMRVIGRVTAYWAGTKQRRVYEGLVQAAEQEPVKTQRAGA